MKRRIEIKRIVTGVVVAAVVLSGAHQARASVVNVFLDDGSAPGSSNTSAPYAIGGGVTNNSDSTWDVLATAENGLSAIGAAVMEVRMLTFNVNGDLRGAGHSTFGLGVTTGSNSGWFDGNTQEAALFELSFFSDVAKSLELTGVDITFKSILARHVPVDTNRVVTVYSGSGVVTTAGAAVFLDGTKMSSANDSTLYDSAQAGLGIPDSAEGQYVTMLGDDSVAFTENNVFWVRRRNLAGVGDAAYQLGAITFDVTGGVQPEAPPIGNISWELLSGTNGLALTWLTTNGFNYAVQSKDDLVTGSWTNHITGIPGVAGDLTVTTAVDQAQSFYRVVVEE